MTEGDPEFLQPAHLARRKFVRDLVTDISSCVSNLSSSSEEEVLNWTDESRKKRKKMFNIVLIVIKFTMFSKQERFVSL